MNNLTKNTLSAKFSKMLKMSKVSKMSKISITEKIFLLIVFVISAFLRFSDLGYSHFYGDETKTLYLDKTIPAQIFFLDQRKGPVQFLVVWIMEKLTGGFDEGTLRIPFAVAGFISVFVVYFLAKKMFLYIFKDEKKQNIKTSNVAAFLTAFLFSVSGFNVAFSRTIQYQSFLILFGLSALYLYFTAVEKLNSKNNTGKYYLLFSSLLLFLAFLSHYDAVFYIVPILFLAFGGFFCADEQVENNTRFTRLFVLYFALPLVFLSAVFYFPYIQKGYFYQNTVNYLLKRMEGSVDFRLNNSLHTFTVYNPFFVFLSLLFFSFLAFFVKENRTVADFTKNIYREKIIKMLTFWFIVPFVVFQFFILNPGTHIQHYFIPLYFMISFVTVYFYQKISLAFFKYLFISVLSFILFFLLSVSIFVYVPGVNTGYPWKQSLFLSKHVEKPNKRYQLFLYGFPYYRGWDQVRDYFKTLRGIKGVYTNDNDTIAQYYLLGYDYTPPGSNFFPQYYIYIFDNQEFHKPNQTFYDDFLIKYREEKRFYSQNELTAIVYIKND